jgi:Flp pilus assembly protein TadG
MKATRASASVQPAPFKAKRLVSRKRFGGLVEDRGGAAIVEFALAIMPVLCIFFGMVQWSIVAYVHLIVKHAAFVAVRCEAVQNTGMPDASTTSGTDDCADPNSGAVSTLFADIPGAKGNITITPTLAGPTTQALDTVQVALTYNCTIPLGNVLACGSGMTQTLSESASFPNQGSVYWNIWGGGGG